MGRVLINSNLNPSNAEALIAAHVANDGSDHSFINQDVTTSASPSFAGLGLSGNLAMNGNRITGLPAPTASSDAATRDYVDSVTGAAVPATLVSPAAFDAAGAVGTQTRLAREDHRHPAQGVSTDAGNSLTVGSDGLHYLALSFTINPATVISPASTNSVGAVGSSPDYARQDHSHPAQPVSSNIGNLLTTGTDGLHMLALAPANGVSPAASASGVIGTSPNYARQDHSHPVQGVSTDAGNAISLGTDSLHFLAASSVLPSAPSTANIGISNAFARADHVHPVQSVSTDAGNLLTNGTDGLSMLALSPSSALPQAPGTANAGTATDYSRADHVHSPQGVSADAGNSLTTGSDNLHYLSVNASSVLPQAPGTANAGTATDYSRADHVHPLQGVSTDAGNSLTIGSDNLHYLSVNASSALPQDLGTASAGTSSDYSRADHTHSLQGVSTDAGNLLTVGSDNLHMLGLSAATMVPSAPGVATLGAVATRFAREDHVHPVQGVSADAGNLLTIGSDNLHHLALAPATVVSPASNDNMGLVGASSNYARQDHKHPAQSVSTDAGNQLTVGTDGLHYLASGTTILPADAVSPKADDSTGLVGTGTEYAREDHKHPAQDVSADAGNEIVLGSDGLHYLAPLPTASNAIPPGAIDNTGAIGSVVDQFALEDHRHPAQGVSADAGNILTVGSDGLHYLASSGSSLTPASAISPAADDTTGEVGSSLDYAREDHKHPAQAVSADAGNLLTAGSDGLHMLALSAADTVSPAATSTGSLGTNTAQFAREDHAHPAQPVSGDAGNLLTTGSDGFHMLGLSAADTVSPAATDSTGTVGTNTTQFAREDHAHPAQGVSADAGNQLTIGGDGLHFVDGIPTAADAISPAADDSTGATGSNTSEFAREDHKHPAQGISADAGNQLTIGGDGLHFMAAVTVPTAADGISPAADDSTGATGSNTSEFAREDHKHPAQGISADAGNALTIGGDGLHYMASVTVPTAADGISPAADDSTGDTGSNTTEFAREDHKHPAQGISADAGNLLTVGSDGLHMLGLSAADTAPSAPTATAVLGTNTTQFAREDHSHAYQGISADVGNALSLGSDGLHFMTGVTVPDPSSVIPIAPNDNAGAIGTGTDYAREDHKHPAQGISTDAGNLLTVGSDFLHMLALGPATTLPVVSDDTLGAIGTVSQRFAREDHKHPVDGVSTDADNRIVLGTDNLHYLTNGHNLTASFDVNLTTDTYYVANATEMFDAITAINASGNASKILMGPGTYSISGATIPTNTHVQGSNTTITTGVSFGGANSRLENVSFSAGVAASVVVSAASCVLENVTISGSTSTNFGTITVSSGGSGFLMKNCSISNDTGRTFRIQDSATIQDCTFTTCADCRIRSDNVTFENCVFDNFGTFDGENLGTTPDYTISKCVFRNCTSTLFDLDYNVNILDSVFDSCSGTIFASSSTFTLDINILRNRFEGTGMTTILSVTSGSATNTNIVFGENMVTGAVATNTISQTFTPASFVIEKNSVTQVSSFASVTNTVFYRNEFSQIASLTTAFESLTPDHLAHQVFISNTGGLTFCTIAARGTDNAGERIFINYEDNTGGSCAVSSTTATGHFSAGYSLANVDDHLTLEWSGHAWFIVSSSDTSFSSSGGGVTAELNCTVVNISAESFLLNDKIHYVFTARVNPAVADSDTRFRVDLPNVTANFTNTYDTHCVLNGWFNDADPDAVQNLVGYASPGNTYCIVRFTSSDTSSNYIQGTITYTPS